MLRSVLHMHLDETKHCFVCGPDNPEGLKLEPYIENENAVVASYVAPDYLCGFKGIVHGGMHCALLDCLSLWTSYLQGKPAVTTEFNVKLLKPVFVGEEIYLRSEMVSEEDDVVIVRGEIRNNRKELCTVSEIRARVLSKERLNKFTGESKANS
jgi:acyl-coenzyme A thioesterase PaaI-like protein